MKPRDIEALLDAERRAPHPPVETQARVLRRVETTLGLAAGVAATATAAKASAATGAHTAAAVGAKAVIVKVVLGAVGAAMLGGGAYVALQHKSTPAALAPAAETSEPVAPRPPPQALVVPRQAPPPPPPRAKPLQKGLADEQAFLEEARAALRNGSPERALNLLQQHERTFPAGQLGEARDVLAIQALIAEGKPDAARARAAEFRRRHPRSLFQPAVDASLPR
jgi:hypothetical protein